MTTRAPDRALALFCLLSLLQTGECARPLQAQEPRPERPASVHEQIVVRAADFVRDGEMPYLAFPDVSRTSNSEVLISYKRGRSHARDHGAILEAVRLNTVTNTVEWRGELGSDPKLIQQMGEWIEFPDGSIGNFVDLQHSIRVGGAERHHRVGTWWTRTTDLGKTFSPMRRLGPVDGIEYGYVFDGVSVGQQTWMLAMTFPELTDRKSSVDEEGRRIYGTVAALRTDDSGKTWHHVCDLNQVFGGLKLNECALTTHPDGFIVASRSYDSEARLHLVNRDFRLIRQTTLTTSDGIIRSQIGRPRLFWRDGSLYLLGRNHRGGPMELALFRIRPETFAVERFVILDPQQDGVKIADGYYAVPWFQETSAGLKFNVLTYRRASSDANPDIVRLEYQWDQIR